MIRKHRYIAILALYSPLQRLHSPPMVSRSSQSSMALAFITRVGARVKTRSFWFTDGAAISITGAIKSQTLRSEIEC